MDWSAEIDAFIMHHRENPPCALADLVARSIISGCEVDWNKPLGNGAMQVCVPPWLPAIPGDIIRLFMALAHGWYCDPFDPPEGHAGRPDLKWVYNVPVWLKWKDQSTDWHWLLPMPAPLPLAAQLDMAAKLFDSLSGDIDAGMNMLEENDSDLTVSMQRRSGETTVTVTRGDDDGDVTTTVRLQGRMRDCFMMAVEQTREDEPVGAAH